MMPAMARQFTEDEVRDQFIGHVWALIDEWDRVGRENGRPTRELLSGLAHSILATLDGAAKELPAFIVAPYPHENDRSFRVDEGENWYPETNRDGIAVDIAGDLHERLYAARRDEAG